MIRPRRFSVLCAALFVLFVTGVLRAQQAPPVAPAVRPNVAPHPAPEQPVPFSHRAHVTRGLRCEMCHTNPEPGAQMAFPAAATCMGCHAVVARDRPAITRLAELSRSGQPIPWVRVYQLLPGVKWTHRKHVQAGVQCETCHGAVGELEAMAEITAVTGMASCVSCHQARQASVACVTCHAWPAS
jgi:hypothetical protein